MVERWCRTEVGFEGVSARRVQLIENDTTASRPERRHPPSASPAWNPCDASLGKEKS